VTLQTDQILAAVRDHAKTLGVFDSVSGHEIKVPPGTGVHCEIIGGSFDLTPTRSGLASTSVKLTFRVRLRTSWNQKPAEDVDARLLKTLDPLMTSYIAGFTLGGLVVAVDILGDAGGQPIVGQFGYTDQGGQPFRTVEFGLPILVDDLWTEAA
jgi:hypothetical protein